MGVCRVVRVDHEGVEYPVAIVPPHGPRPVIAVADGPADERKQPVGIREGTIYIRAPGPESVAVRRPDDCSRVPVGNQTRTYR
jgi:hypothetical protein